MHINWIQVNKESSCVSVMPRQSLDYCLVQELRLGRMDLSTLKMLLNNLLCNQYALKNCSNAVKSALDLYVTNYTDSCAYDKVWANVVSDLKHLCPVMDLYCPLNSTDKQCEVDYLTIEFPPSTVYKPVSNKNYYAVYSSKRWDLINVFGLHQFYIPKPTKLGQEYEHYLQTKVKTFLSRTAGQQRLHKGETNQKLVKKCKFWRSLFI